MQREESTRRLNELNPERIWESIFASTNPVKEFAGIIDERTMRNTRIGLVLASILVSLAALPEVAFFAVLAWYLCE